MNALLNSVSGNKDLHDLHKITHEDLSLGFKELAELFGADENHMEILKKKFIELDTDKNELLSEEEIF